ncbi:MAG: ABC transporter ATP-binding protein [Planctomycetes bacterium]|nr:ABC transporter ATP-binding protein [Planctomycetota bacterium]
MIQVTDLRKSYGETEAVRGISFDVRPGEVLGLVGPNGAGKTTTLRCLAGILPPTSGSVAIAGRDLRLDPVGAKARLAWIPDDPRLFENLTVEEHLRFIGRLYRVEDAEERIPALLEEFEIAGKAGELPGALSRGMKQKLSIACAFLHRPKAILFDEPLTGLDPIAIRKAKDSIVRQAEEGAAIIVSSHLLALVEEIAHRVLVILDGAKAAHGTLEELKAAHPDLAAGARLEEIFMRMALGPAAGAAGAPPAADPPPPPGPLPPAP